MEEEDEDIFNSASYVEGKSYQLDVEFRNTSVVTLLSKGRVYCRIRNAEGDEWNVMLCRLTEIQ